MPRYATEKIYQLGDYWLSKRAGSDAWYRTWFDSEARQTRRISLATDDLEMAKQALNEWFILHHTKTEQKAADVSLAELFARYYEHHGSKLGSPDNVQRALRYWLEFHKAAAIQEACTPQQQQAFRTFLEKDKKLSLSTVRQVLTIGKAALNWSWRRGEIEEVARLIDAADYHLKAFIIMMIAATARNRAILDLTFEQVDFKHDLIDLNPTGRKQTLKFRPQVKIPVTVKPWLLRQKELSQAGHIVEFRDAPVRSICSAWRTLRSTLELDDAVQPYGLRHTMARWLRKSSVPAWEVAAQLGHKTPDVSTTEIYAPFDPVYLKQSTAAIDAFLTEVALHLRYKTISELMLENI